MLGKIAELLTWKLYTFKYDKEVDKFLNILLDYGKYQDADTVNMYIVYEGKRYKISVDSCYDEVPGSLCRVFTNFGYETELVYGHTNKRPSFRTILKLLMRHNYLRNKIQTDKEHKRILDAMRNKVPTWSKELPIEITSPLYNEELYLVKDKYDYCLIWLCKENGNTKIIHAEDYSMYSPDEFCNENMYFYGPIKLESVNYPDFKSSNSIEKIKNAELGSVVITQRLHKDFIVRTPDIV